MSCSFCHRPLSEAEEATPTGREGCCFSCASASMIFMGYTEDEACDTYFGKETPDAPDGGHRDARDN